MPLMVTIQPKSFATNIHKRYSVYFVCHYYPTPEKNGGGGLIQTQHPDHDSRCKKIIDALDRSTMDPLECKTMRLIIFSM